MTNEPIMIDGEIKNCKVLFKCNSVDDLASYNMIKEEVEVTPDNAPVFNKFDITLIAEPKSPYGYSVLFKRNENINEWEYMGFGHSGACSIVTALLKQLQRKTAECENARKRILDLEARIINHSKELEEYCSRLADSAKECEKLKKRNTEMYKELEWFRDKAVTELKRSVKIIKIDEGENDNYKQALEPFEDEYFKGLDTTQIAELAKKSIRLTTYNRDLKCALDEIEKILDDDDFRYCPMDGEEDCHYNTYLKILDIISNVKGE